MEKREGVGWRMKNDLDENQGTLLLSLSLIYLFFPFCNLLVISPFPSSSLFYGKFAEYCLTYSVTADYDVLRIFANEGLWKFKILFGGLCFLVCSNMLF